MATQSSNIETLLRWGAILGALFTVNEVVGLFKPAPPPNPGAGPGGTVTPATNPDTRPATLTAPQAVAIADAIEVDVYGGVPLISLPWERDNDFAAQLMKAQVTADVALLVNAYGQRGELWNKKGLAATVTDYLDTSNVAQVNADYVAKNIRFAW